jgi:hypothetical protein
MEPDPFLLHQADQAQVDGPLVHDQGTLPDLLDATSDTVAVQRPELFQRLESHQVEGALKNG